MREKEFNLADFINTSLSIGDNYSPATKPMFDYKNPYSSVYEEEPLKLLGELSFNSPKEIPEHSVGTPIQEFFRGVNVFITGGSGFLGKVLTEKLVRAMPHIGHVYLLIRPKRGKSCEERFKVLLEDKVFSRMKAEVPHYQTKITAVAGDISEPDLGLSKEDREMLINSVHVVFHCAADVRFLEPLDKVMVSNVLGSKHVLNLAKSVNGIKAYVHVSTAYSQCIYRVIEENVPKMTVNYKDVLNFLESNIEHYSEDEIKKIMQGWPNTYTFSKALCEDMIREEAQDLPICIVRPSVVISTSKEPVRGWTDNLYGPLGLVLGGSLGVLHCLRLNQSNSLDAVPVDYLINFLIAAAFKTGSQSDNGVVPVYNFTLRAQNIVCWKTIIENDMVLDYWPSCHAVWYNSFFSTHGDLQEKICFTILHKIPGVVLDKLVELSGRKPRLGKIYKTLETVKEPLRFFMVRYFQFKNENVTRLWNDLSEEDKKLFHFDTIDINWIEYFIVAWLGLRYYYLKESMDTIPAAQIQRKCLRVAHKGLKLLFGFGVLKLAVCLARVIPY